MGGCWRLEAWVGLRVQHFRYRGLRSPKTSPHARPKSIAPPHVHSQVVKAKVTSGCVEYLCSLATETEIRNRNCHKHSADTRPQARSPKPKQRPRPQAKLQTRIMPNLKPSRRHVECRVRVAGARRACLCAHARTCVWQCRQCRFHNSWVISIKAYRALTVMSI